MPKLSANASGKTSGLKAANSKASAQVSEKATEQTAEQTKVSGPQRSSRERATYSTGKERLANILEAAKSVLIQQGMAAFSMRRIAKELDISIGNLTYYYPSKEALLTDLIDYVLEPYFRVFAEFRAAAGDDPATELRAVLDYVVGDLATPETTRFFPEFWVYANRHEEGKAHMASLYDEYRGVLQDIVGRMRPDLGAQQVEDIALVVQASVEGHTMFLGYNRTHNHRMSAVKPLLVNHCVALVEGRPN